MTWSGCLTSVSTLLSVLIQTHSQAEGKAQVDLTLALGDPDKATSIQQCLSHRQNLFSSAYLISMPFAFTL